MELEPILSLKDLSVSIDSRPLVRNLDMALMPNQTLCLVGESGSGKTTTAMACMGLLSKKRGFSVTGRISFAKHELLGLSERAWSRIRGKSLSMIFQDPASSLNPVFPIAEQIGECFEIHSSLSKDEIEIKMLEALESVGLRDSFDPFETYPHQLSGGMKQRILIAMALLFKPKLLIADEPTSALDLTVQKEILALIKTFTCSKLIITHDFGVVAEMADMVAVMYAGEIVEFAPVVEIFENPIHPYTKGLLAARPRPENVRKMLPTVPKFEMGEKIVSISPTHWVRQP